MKSTSNSTTHKRESRTESRRGIVAALLTVILLCAMLSGCSRDLEIFALSYGRSLVTRLTAPSNEFNIDSVTFSVTHGIKERSQIHHIYDGVNYFHITFVHYSDSQYDTHCTLRYVPTSNSTGGFEMPEGAFLTSFIDNTEANKDIYLFEDRSTLLHLKILFSDNHSELTFPVGVFEEESGWIHFHTATIARADDSENPYYFLADGKASLPYTKDGDRIIFDEKEIVGRY